MPKQPKPSSTSPIKDINKNGYLDGEDLREQLRAEEENGSDRTPNEKVHGILETAGLREFSKAYNKAALSNGLNGHEFEEAARILTDLLKTDIENMKKHGQRFSREQMLDVARLLCAKKGIEGDSLEINIADIANSFDFAQTFDQTFPKGIKLEADDMPEIMMHFGQLAVPVIIQAAPETDSIPPKKIPPR